MVWMEYTNEPPYECYIFEKPTVTVLGVCSTLRSTWQERRKEGTASSLFFEAGSFWLEKYVSYQVMSETAPQ